MGAVRGFPAPPVLAVQRGGQRLHIGDGPAAGGQLAHQFRRGEIDADILHARCPQRFHRDADDFGKGGHGIAADQLRPGLRQFARWVQLGGAGARHLPDIGEAQRARRVCQAGGGDAGDLAGDVGPDGERRAGGGIGRAEQRAAQRPPQPAGQRRLAFHQRRGDALIAVGGEGVDDGARQRRGGLGGGRKPVAEAAGQQGCALCHLALLIRRTSAPSPSSRRAGGAVRPAAPR